MNTEPKSHPVRLTHPQMRILKNAVRDGVAVCNGKGATAVRRLEALGLVSVTSQAILGPSGLMGARHTVAPTERGMAFQLVAPRR